MIGEEDSIDSLNIHVPQELDREKFIQTNITWKKN